MVGSRRNGDGGEERGGAHKIDNRGKVPHGEDELNLSSNSGPKTERRRGGFWKRERTKKGYEHYRIAVVMRGKVNQTLGNRATV